LQVLFRDKKELGFYEFRDAFLLAMKEFKKHDENMGGIQLTQSMEVKSKKKIHAYFYLIHFFKKN
jgi:hypothetical protein